MVLPVSLILFALAAACNAVMDTLVHHHNTSVFKHHAKGFWSDAYLQSWKNKYIDGDPEKGRKKIFGNINYPVQLTDAWHFFKTILIFLIVFAIVFYKPMFTWWIEIIVFGVVWNCTFSLFYKKLFIQPKKSEK